MHSKRYLALLALLFFCCQSHDKSEESNAYFMGQIPPGNIPEVFGEGVISVKGRFDLGFTISPSGKSLAFGTAHESDPKKTCIYAMNYVEGGWSLPDNSFLPRNENTYFPMFGPDGKQIYFAKQGSESDTDLWVAKYVQNKAMEPHLLDSIFNSKAREAGHGKSKNGSFYFTSNRDDKNACCGDIYHSKFETNSYTPPQKVEKLSLVYDEESLFLSPNEDYMIIQAWKSEYDSKHDLFISYRNNAGEWSSPKRLNTHINSIEIEQRPFISPDNEFLFFSRTTIVKENDQEIYESDIYWVSTSSIFEPFIYNTQIDTSVEYMKPFGIALPPDLFQDIDDPELSYHATLSDDSQLPEWIIFDPIDLRLTGSWKSAEPISIKIIATDSSDNTGTFVLKLDAN